MFDYDYLLYSHPPITPLQNDRSSARTSTIWTGVLLLTFLRKIATISSETILFHVMPLQNDRSLSKPYKMGCCSYFLASHASKGLASRLRRIYLRAFIHFLFPHHAPTKWEVPVETAIIIYNMVWCFVISCAYSSIPEDTTRGTKTKIWVKVILSICVLFLFPRPPSCHIMPLQNDRFPSKHLQDGLALWLFSNMQLKTVDSSKLLGFLTPIMLFLPKNTDTHTQRTTWSLANLFPHGFESWDGKMQRTLLWFYSLQSGFLMHLGFTTKWVSWNWSRKSVLDSFRLLRAHQSPVFCLQIGS